MPDGLTIAYDRCRRLHQKHGRTYYLATRLLPVWKRRHVHALYGFARYADEIVDRTADRPVAERERLLRDWSRRFVAGLHGERVDDPLLPAVLHTITVFGLDHRDFEVFLESMAMDLTVTGYADYPALLAYMEGSAAVIGTMMLPILQADDLAAAREPARQLGLAFQLTNFIRDVAEDLDRGRVYLPEQDLAEFGVTRADLTAATAAGKASPAIRALIEFEVVRAWLHYRRAAPGIPLLAARSQTCIRAAYQMYSGILRAVQDADYDVFARRVTVPTWHRLGLAARSVITPPGTPVTVPFGG
ncbi:MAG TPA: phytoene/squalene synthase family protein [Actinophytocola sp.]|uniref:phytoene/squalene synthase family protein n=1 Tax=Actinophytocola sp. TaxID=1872138 RepID=UPI002DBE93AC|nr:phytoene/squalene synthase family protein [Actinophytocola sp.]HEU5473311.1 phytoene/squalene synthase family protein [Actinophytocola sp.]